MPVLLPSSPVGKQSHVCAPSLPPQVELSSGRGDGALHVQAVLEPRVSGSSEPRGGMKGGEELSPWCLSVKEMWCKSNHSLGSED